MAGESPDKSEQRKSSGETTGSERDPRLAMFREGSPASPASSEPSPPSSAATDERTAVFRLPPRDRAETAGATAGEAPAEASADAEPGDGGADASAPSAGVPAGAGAEGDGGVPADAAGDGGVTDAAASASASASASSDDEPSGTATDDEAAEEERGAESGEDSGAGSDTEAAEAGSGAGADAEAEAEAPEGGSDADSVSGAAGTRNAPDADADADTAPEKPEDGADRTAAKPAVDATADDAGDDANDDASDDASASSSDAPAGDERLRAAVAAWVATGDDEPGDGSESAGTPQKASPEAAQAPEADGTAPGDAEKGRAPAAGSEPTSSLDGDDDEVPLSDASDASDAEDDDAPATAAAEEASAPAPKSTPDADGSGDTDTDTDTDSGKTPAGDTPAVDQPTAVFKAPKRPVVDQPTTALKLPKPASDPEPATPAGAEADSERTSTFVPLRRDDARPAAAGAAARPKPATPAAPAAKATTAEADAPAASLTEAERTRQQPMPPLPPLDLLAELTNTPPPPETPTRTVVRRIKIWTPLVALLLIVFAIAQAVRPLPEPELTLTADAEYTFDGGRPSLPWPDEGQGQIVVSGVGVVGQFGDEKPVPIASVTKTMTAYIIMRDHPLKRGEDGESIPVDALAEKEGGYDETNDESTLNTIKEGDTISVRDALSAIMIPSANNVARLVARWDAGSEEAFVKKMNDTAKDLGMTNTTYTDPSGLDATTVSTAADQVKLGQALVKNKAMVDITRVQEWYDPSGKRHSNYNTLMPRNGAIGIKTGSTTKAGGNLLFAAYKDIGGSTQTIVGAVLSQHESPILETVNRVSEEVLVATREALLEQKVVKKGDVVGYVDDGLGGQTPVVATKDLTIVGWTGLKLEASITDGGKKLPHTAEAGTVVGSLTAGTGPGTISVPVALQQDLVEPGFGDKLTRIG
ncbi:serine hydrolase [Streptomyces zhihengii]|uniref:serine hydrolase n=1 Tax=Streptomyces zhihengii TaxID=1818004 RepID=UPI003687263B